MNAQKAAWEVTAGLIPGQPMPEYTRVWSLQANEWADAEGFLLLPHAIAFFNAQTAAAMEYARALMEPASLNWVRVDWIWF
jgi:hypothetical protein